MRAEALLRSVIQAVAGAAVLLALALGSAATPRAQAVQGIAAVVNDDIVSTRAVLDRVQLVLATTNLPGDAETRLRLEQQVLRVLIDEALQRQEAARLNIAVTDEETAAALNTIAQRNSLTVEQMAQLLERSGSSITALSQQLTAQIAWLKVIGREVRPQVVVTDQQVEFAARSAPAVAGDRELLLSEILLPVYDPGQEAAVIEDARELVAAVRGGADFAGLARQVSASPSAESGGDLGWIATTALNEQLRAVLAQTEPGQLAPPLRTANGIQIFLVRDARRLPGDEPAAAAAPDAATREAVRQRLIEEQTQRLANRYLRDLRLDAFIDVRL